MAYPRSAGAYVLLVICSHIGIILMFRYLLMLYFYNNLIVPKFTNVRQMFLNTVLLYYS